MNPVDFPGGNTVLGKPRGMDMPDVEVTPISVYQDDTRIIGMFEPDPEELVDILRTRRVVVSILGNAWPPVRLDVLKVKQDDEYEKIRDPDTACRFLLNALQDIVNTDDDCRKSDYTDETTRLLLRNLAAEAVEIAQDTFGLKVPRRVDD